MGFLKMAAEDMEDLSPLAKDFSLLIPIKHFALAKNSDWIVQLDVAGAGKATETT